MVRLEFPPRLIRLLLRLLMTAHTLASRDVAKVVAVQAVGLTLHLSALAVLAPREPLDGRARETMRANATLTLKVTPAMEAGLTDHVWSLEELCVILPKPTVKTSTTGSEMVKKALGESA
jgi:hypothetical protein